MTRPRAHLPRWRRPRHLIIALLAIALVTLSIVLLVTFSSSGWHLQRPGRPPLGYLRAPLGGRLHRVAAWTLGDAASLTAATDVGAVDEIDFDWYQSRADGSVAAVNERLSLVAAARAHELNLFATVTNQPANGGPFSRKVAASIIATPQTRSRHIRVLARLVVDKGYDGIDLDWEELHAADRAKFSLFVEQLATALHMEHRFLSVTVYAKTSEPGTWAPQKAMDYARLGAAADELKIMTYGYSGSWSEPGPQAPTRWMDRVFTFAESQVPPAKLSMGVPFFGFDWHGGHTSVVDAHSAAALATGFHATAERDPASQEAVLRYTDAGGVRHVLYFQDARSIAAKMAFLQARHPQLGGAAFWVMGQETPQMWAAVRDGLSAGP